MRDVIPKIDVINTNVTNIATCKQNARSAGIGTNEAVKKIDIAMKFSINIGVPADFNTIPTCFLPMIPVYFRT